MTRILLIALLCLMQVTSWAQTRRPIDSQHPMWLVHIDVWNNADPQKIIDLIPEDIKPYVVLNLSMSCAYNKEINIHQKPQSALRTYKSWGSIAQKNKMWFTCQPASGGHTHIQDWDLETFEYFFKRYPNFLGWNYAEQFWGFNDPGDKFSSSDETRIALFAELVKMSHKYGGFLTVSFCGNIWSHHLNPNGMLKRNKDLMQACKDYPEAIIWLYKYTTSSCFYNNESVSFGPFVAGLAKNYGVRYDNCGYNGALDDMYPHTSDGSIDPAYKSQRDARKYPVAAGIGTVLEQTGHNGGAVWDGPELIWTEDFQTLSNTTVDNYTVRRWGRFPGFDNAWIDMFRKIIDGTVYIPTHDEVVENTPLIIYNNVTSGNDEDKYATWGSLYDNLYKQDDPFNKGNGQFMNNYWYLKKTGRYGTIPITPGFNTDMAARFKKVVKKASRTTDLPDASKVSIFNGLYPEISTGDLFVTRLKNQLITYTPYTYWNAKTTASANVPLKYNTCESLSLTFGKLSSGVIREFSDHINFYLNNYRSDTTTNVVDKIIVNGATSKPSYTFTKRTTATASASASEAWDEANKAYTITVSHNGPVDLQINCAGTATGRATDAIAITPLEAPKQPEATNDVIIVEAEDMNYQNVEDCVTDQYGHWGEKYRSVRGHSAMGFQVFKSGSQSRLKYTLKSPRSGKYRFEIRYSTPSKVTGKLQCKAGSAVAQTINFEATEVNEWKKIGFNTSLVEGDNNIVIVNTDSKRIFIDQVILIPEDMDDEKYAITIRESENGTATADVQEAAEGTKVTLNVTPKEGFEFAGWNIIHGGSYVGGDVKIADDNTFIMPDEIVTLEPLFNDKSAVYILDYTDVLGGTFPPGWRCEFDNYGTNTVNEYPNNYSSGPRTMTGFPGTYGKGLYWRTGDVMYGKQTNYPLHLAPGKYKLTFTVAAWKGTPTYKAQIKTKAGSVLATSSSYTATPNANGQTSANLSTAVTRTLEFEVKNEADYIININGNGEQLLLSCNLNSVIDPTGIEETVLAPIKNGGKYEIYDEVGRRIAHLKRGVNIIRMNGEIVRKVILK